MTTIIVTHEDNEIDEFGFDATDQIISIGRRSTNNVCIPNLSVSGVHARITIDGSSALIEDNNSTNGTYVNGRLISRQLINEDDEIVIGKTRVIVKLSNQSSVRSQPRPDNSINESMHHTEAANSKLTDADQQAMGATEPPTLSTVPAFGTSESNPSAAALLNDNPDSNSPFNDNPYKAAANSGQSVNNTSDTEFGDADDSYVGEPSPKSGNRDQFDDRPMTLSEKAKLALGRENASPRPGLKTVAAAGLAATSASAAASRAFASDTDTPVAEAPTALAQQPASQATVAHPLDGLDSQISNHSVETIVNDPISDEQDMMVEDVVSTAPRPTGAVIEIQNGAKSGQILPIDKPVTTLGRPGIQIAAIMRKPDGYFLMHIESDDCIDMPTLNRDTIGDDPVMLNSGDRLNVAGIDVEFILS